MSNDLMPLDVREKLIEFQKYLKKEKTYFSKDLLERGACLYMSQREIHMNDNSFSVFNEDLKISESLSPKEINKNKNKSKFLYFCTKGY